MAEPVWPSEELKRHQTSPGPKRILALDGGGVRGILSIGVLQRIEDVLAAKTGRGESFVLSDYFDLIAGTSTGSIIATLLAMGKRVSDVKGFYDAFAPKVFAKAQAVGARVPKFHESAFEALLQQTFGDLTVGAPELKTGLLICAKRMDTGSQWAIINDPRSKYYFREGTGTLPNRDYLLRTLIRASTAAPFYFEPVRVTIAEHPDFPTEVGMFVDGGVGGDNNPSLQALKTATLKGYGVNWETGADKLLLFSVGTGWRKAMIDIDAYQRMWNWQKSAAALAGMIQDSVQHNIVTLQALSEPRKPFHINRELGDMRGMRVTKELVLTYQRCDAWLEEDDVAESLGLQGKERRRVKRIVKGLMQMDNASKENLRYLYALGCAAGQKRADGSGGIDAEDFPDVFNI